jgi:3-oxoacyl-[acyl-carrier protein] reductase
VLKEIKALWGVPDYLVNGIGYNQDQLFVQVSDEQWQQTLQANLFTVHKVTRALIFSRLKRGSGAICTLGSLAGTIGSSGRVPYTTDKAGVIGFTRALARELGPFGIRVNALAPGVIASRMVQKISPRYPARMLGQIPLGRWGSPEEVAAGAAFLLSDQAGYIQGQTLLVDGGLASAAVGGPV